MANIYDVVISFYFELYYLQSWLISITYFDNSSGILFSYYDIRGYHLTNFVESLDIQGHAI